MKTFVRWFFTDRQWRMLARFKEAMRSECIKGISRCIRILPLGLQAGIKESLVPIGYLDYQHESIRMFVNSHWQMVRLWSCAKEPETVKWIEDNLKPGDIFYDVGANVGAYSLVALAVTGGGAKVYAFEPGFATFNELCWNIPLNNAQNRIVPLQIGLGAKTELLDFRYSELIAGAAQHSWDGSVSQKGENFSSVYTQPTLSYRMDDLIDMLRIEVPALIKIDVDGPELEVLNGANRTLLNPIVRSLLIESDEHLGSSVVALLKDKGFCLQHQHHRTAGLSNYIFRRG